MNETYMVLYFSELKGEKERKKNSEIKHCTGRFCIEKDVEKGTELNRYFNKTARNICCITE